MYLLFSPESPPLDCLGWETSWNAEKLRFSVGRTQVNGDSEHQNLNGNSIKEKEIPNENENFQVSFKLISDRKVLVKMLD